MQRECQKLNRVGVVRVVGVDTCRDKPGEDNLLF